MKSLLSLMLVFSMISGCCSSKKANNYQSKSLEVENKFIEELSISIVEELNFDSKLYTFPRFKATLNGEQIDVKLTYGGGCKEHDFQAFSTGKIQADGVIEILLVDFTTDDRCRAFVQKELTIKIEQAAFKQSKLRINGIEL